MCTQVRFLLMINFVFINLFFDLHINSMYVYICSVQIYICFVILSVPVRHTNSVLGVSKFKQKESIYSSEAFVLHNQKKYN